MFFHAPSTKPEVGLVILTVVVFCAIGVVIGIQKGEPVAGFLLGLILGPLGLFFLLVSPGTVTHCPFCCQRIKKDSNACRYCGQDLSVPTSQGGVNFRS